MIITIAQNKGGCSKTTTAAALAAGLSRRGVRVLAVDTDSQSNLSFIMGAKKGRPTVLSVVGQEVSAKDAIQTTDVGDIIPASPLLAAADVSLLSAPRTLLADALRPVTDKYDFIIMDTPPSLGALTLNAIAAADAVIIPTTADVLSIQGVGLLRDTVDDIRKNNNKGLRIAGILLTQYNARSSLSKKMTAMIERRAQDMGTKLFKSRIRSTVSVRESQILQKSLFTYAPKSTAAADYMAFIDELLEDAAGKGKGK